MIQPTCTDPALLSTLARLWRKTSVEGDWNGTPHWLFTGKLNTREYAQLLDSRTGKLVLAHRLGQEAYFGPILPGYEVDHLCRVKHCWAPGHTESVTSEVNRERAQPFRVIKTHCHRGHEFTPETTHVIDRGNGKTSRRCLTCRPFAPPAQRGPDGLKTHCLRGPELTFDNVYLGKNANGVVARTCKTCAADRQTARRAAARAGLPGIEPGREPCEL